MRVISHRGAAGLAPENTLASIEAAKKHRPDVIEIDVQATADDQLVLIHDDSLSQIADDSRKVRELSLKEIYLVRTYSGQPIPTLLEAFDAAGSKPLLIDCKGQQWSKPLAKAIKQHKGTKPLVASGDFQELLEFQKLSPKSQTFYSELTKPFEAIQTAKVLKFSGVCLLYSLYSPPLYFLAKRYGLKMTMFTINKRFLAKFLHLFYPKVMITTDYPNLLKPPKRPRKSK